MVTVEMARKMREDAEARLIATTGPAMASMLADDIVREIDHQRGLVAAAAVLQRLRADRLRG
jgi:hypothetical protein